MAEGDLMRALQESYHDVQSRNGHRPRRERSSGFSMSSLRRYLRYALDLMDIYLDIQRDRRWVRDDDW